jgi:ribose transport system substrate-binding protein
MPFALTGAHAAAAACALALVVSACGGGSSSSTSPSGSPSGTTAASPGGVSKAALAERLAEDYRGTFKELPASGPKGVPGKSIVIIPLTQLTPTFSAFTQEATAAAKSLGWNVTVIDGKLSTEGYNKALRTATSQHPDAILISGIECAPVQQAALEAKKAGIIIYSVYGGDCATPVWSGFQPVDTRAAARMRADWIASKIGPNDKVVEAYLTDDVVIKRFEDDTEKNLKQTCPGCKIARISFVLGDLGEPLKGKIQTGLLRNPDAKAFIAPFDAAILFGAGAAIQGSGLHMQIMGGECSGANLALIRAGTQQHACTGYPFSVFGWSSIDGLNRIFAKAAPAPAGLGVQLVDLEHNMPPKDGVFLGPLSDFREHYKKIWGVE